MPIPTELNGNTIPLRFLLASITEEIKAENSTVMALKFSREPKISESPPWVRSRRKCNEEEMANKLIEQVEHRNIGPSVKINFGMSSVGVDGAREEDQFKKYVVLGDIQKCYLHT